MELNERLWTGEFQPSVLPSRLRSLGYGPKTCVVLEMYPDSGETWVVRLVNTDREVIEVDLDLQDSANIAVSPVAPSSYADRRGQMTLKLATEMLSGGENAA